MSVTKKKKKKRASFPFDFFLFPWRENVGTRRSAQTPPPVIRSLVQLCIFGEITGPGLQPVRCRLLTRKQRGHSSPPSETLTWCARPACKPWQVAHFELRHNGDEWLLTVVESIWSVVWLSEVQRHSIVQKAWFNIINVLQNVFIYLTTVVIYYNTHVQTCRKYKGLITAGQSKWSKQHL